MDPPSNQFNISFLQKSDLILSRIQNSIQHINSLDDAKFKKLLQRVAEKTGRQVENFPFLSSTD